jgi:hypothetical protein
MGRAALPFPLSTWPGQAQRKTYSSKCRPCFYLQGLSHEVLPLHYLCDGMGHIERMKETRNTLKVLVNNPY